MANDGIPTSMDEILKNIGVAVANIETFQGSPVKLAKAEFDLLVQLEVARDVMQKILKDGDRQVLLDIFGGDSGDCMRIARLRAVCELVHFSDMNAGDQRLQTCLRACESVEGVVRDQGLGERLKIAVDNEKAAIHGDGKTAAAPADLQQVDNVPVVGKGYAASKRVSDAAVLLPGTEDVLKTAFCPSLRELVLHSGYKYAILGGGDPNGKAKMEPTEFRVLPTGWEIAPYDPDIVSQVVKTHGWSANVLNLNGGSHYTKNYRLEDCPGKLQQSELGYASSGPYSRILIRKPLAEVQGLPERLEGPVST
eukprot:TRINITY_DN55953_c0_g1_i1.p1 TRINITY_DN55953_c0_g1~~TRINITY_DN55953_c0_g1_i1.p1  ORF type:complete len:322 (-),score=49.15 TRINITY_DN55953_c0_g1_i1:58-984(-)